MTSIRQAQTDSGRTVDSSLIAVGRYDEVKDLIERYGDFFSAYGRNEITPAQELIDMQNRFGGKPDGEPFLKRAESLCMMWKCRVKNPEGVPGA